MKCTPGFEKRMQPIMGSIICYGGAIILYAIAAGAYFDYVPQNSVLAALIFWLGGCLFFVSVLWCKGEINFCKDDKTG
jgi:hypothetical protein